jgi:hypothetical protein
MQHIQDQVQSGHFEVEVCNEVSTAYPCFSSFGMRSVLLHAATTPVPSGMQEDVA